MSWCQWSTELQDTEENTSYEEDLPASVYKLRIEERGKSVVLENTLSGGLCGVVTASGGVATDVTATQ